MPGTVLTFCLIYFIVVTRLKGVNCKATTKIIGGHPVDIRDRPYMLSLHSFEGFLCGATILSRSWGITALHCFVSGRMPNYFVRAGSNKPYEGGSCHRVTSIHVYNASTFLYWPSRMLYHDLALFKVKPRFRFSSTVQAIRLPNVFSEPPPLLYVSGWGFTSLPTDELVSSVLMGVYVHHTPHEVCINETPEYRALVKKDHHLCYGAPGKDSCYGDSGGPLASRNIIYGVISFGENCGVVSGIYEKLSYYRGWIKQVTNL